MKSFFPVSIFIICLFAGCATVSKQDLAGEPLYPVTPELIGSPFAEPFEKAMFKANLDIGKNHITGYLLIKKTSDSSFRFAFTSEIGISWFDLELVNRELIKHAIFGPLDKKALISIFEQDFNALIYTVGACPGPKAYPVIATGNYALIGGKNPVYRYRIDFENQRSGIARQVVLKNPAIKLTMTLRLMGE
ncbi:MAG: hypothetical protein M0P58_10660 [Bacteroidales bacterium]|jgi:hypothetical protein|nr:hypothetical protein [Bacteroidales bacterium]